MIRELPIVDADASDYECALAFVEWLEGMGARFSWRDGEQHDWWLDLDAVVGLTRSEAATLAREALDHADTIRAVLLARRDTGSIH